jgi:hypothetical protein
MREWSESSFGYLLLLILVGFSLLIYFLLKVRRRLQEQDLLIDPELVWKNIAPQAEAFNLAQSEMIYGIFQDKTSTTISLLVHDHKGQLKGRIDSPMGSREKTLTIGEEKYLIQILPTWNRKVILRSYDEEKVIATFTQSNILGRHEFDVVNFGVLKSERHFRNYKTAFDYKLNGKTCGSKQAISSIRESGRVAIISSEIPEVVRIFILSM